MPRSVKVGKEYIPKVKAAVQRQGYPRQKDLAEDLGMSLATVSNFLNGKPVDYLNFIDICDKLGLDGNAIKATDSNGSNELLPEEPEEDFIYVGRPPIESICQQTLCQPGALLRIKAPGLMGKTSLMARVLRQLKDERYHTVCVNLHCAEEPDFTNLDRFLRWLCVSVGQSLGMANRIADYWDEEYSTSKMNCITYFEQYLLKQLDSPLVLCLDEVERVFPHPIAAEFLGLLRVWHENAKTRQIWKKLRLVVVHSTEVYVQLKVNESPFNVGMPIELREFTLEQVKNFSQQYGLVWDLVQVKQLMDMVGGHPYLIEKTCSYLQINTSVTLEELLQTAPTEAGIYSNYLRRYWGMFHHNKDLAEALKKVVMTEEKLQLEPMQGYQLHRLGLVQQVGNEVKIACNLYRQYFSYCFGVS